MSLWNLCAGTGGVVNEIEECSQDVLERLKEIGITVGSTITCVRDIPFGGPKLYCLSDSVFSLEKELAQKINIS